MRVMVLVKANADTEAGVLPAENLMVEMGKYNEALVDAGILLAGDGLQPTAKGVRVRFHGADRTVVSGPFDSNDLVAGFWIWKVDSMEQAIEWAKRCPNPTGTHSELEIRPIFETEDFADLDPTGELRKAEHALRARVEGKA